jgi:hypothetical protein
MKIKTPSDIEDNLSLPEIFINFDEEEGSSVYSDSQYLTNVLFKAFSSSESLSKFLAIKQTSLNEFIVPEAIKLHEIINEIRNALNLIDYTYSEPYLATSDTTLYIFRIQYIPQN